MNSYMIFGGLGLILFGVILAYWRVRRTQGKGLITRALNLTLYSVTLPPAEIEEGKTPKEQLEHLVAPMEQLLGSLIGLRSKGIKRFLYGDPYVVLEMAVQKDSKEILNYVAVPRTFSSIFEKQVHSFFPHAEVRKENDYSIFDENSFVLGSEVASTRSSILSLMTYKNLEVDPMATVVTAMSNIAELGEGVAVQFVVSPYGFSKERSHARKVLKEMREGHNFDKAVMRVKDKGRRELKETLSPEYKEKQAEKEFKRHKQQADENIAKAIQEKVAKHHFRVGIRVVASAESIERAEQILTDLETAFDQFDNPEGNALRSRRISKGKISKFIFNYVFRMFAVPNYSILSTEELASFYHFRLSQGGVPRLRVLRSKAAEPPANLPSEGVIIGETLYRGDNEPVRMGLDDRRRHMYIIGQTGTGKTGLLKNMIRQDILSGEGLAVMDPHGELAQWALTVIPPERQKDIVWFDPGDVSRPFGLNMLEFDPERPEQKTLVVNELLAIFKKLFLAETMGPVFDQYFRNATLLLLDDYAHEIPTLTDINRVLVDKEYRKDKLSRETNLVIKDFWEKEAEQVKGEAALSNIAPYITSKINGFVADEFINPIVSQKQSTINFREAMDQKKIILVNLSKGKLGEINSSLIGLVIVGKLLIAALSREDMPQDQRNDFFLYMDEFQNFTTDSISSILSEARKYRLNLVIAHQFIKQLDEKIVNAVFGNVGSTIAFRVGADDAEYLEKQFLPVFTKEDLMNIDNFNAYVKLLVGGQTTKPFNMRLVRPQ
ncbi:MAG: type IV secretion system DNA-binding domain-containing protein [Candidatus Colwellbacteria bacterium]|nr:type IV secretion system DNA-binding domain-containing protein [Candidatus Colwellbacteria bacterium]